MDMSAREDAGVAHGHKIQTNLLVFPQAKVGPRSVVRTRHPLVGPVDGATKQVSPAQAPCLDVASPRYSKFAQGQPPTGYAPDLAIAHIIPLQIARCAADA